MSFKDVRRWFREHRLVFQYTANERVLKERDRTQAAIDDRTQVVSRMRKDHEDAIQNERARIDELVRNLSNIEFYRGAMDSHYRLSVTFDTRMMEGYGRYDDGLKIIAECVGRDVEQEIASSRFVQSALENERKRYMPTPTVRPAILGDLP